MNPAKGPIMDLAFGNAVTAMKELIAFGLEFYKGVGFMNLTFDCWTSRFGFPILGSDLSLNAPRLVSRQSREHACPRPKRRRVKFKRKRRSGVLVCVSVFVTHQEARGRF